MLKTLIKDYGTRYSVASIYILFLLASLIVSAILFGVLHSTGVMKFGFNTAVEEAEFGGAFAGFLATLIFLVKSYNKVVHQPRSFITGNVFWEDGRPAQGASVFVEGIERQRLTDATGWFQIEVGHEGEWTVRATLNGASSHTTCVIANQENPIRLTLEKVPGEHFSQIVAAVIHPEGLTNRFALRAGQVANIGRDPSSDILIPQSDKAASRKHASLEVFSMHLRITDTGSRNGTLVNGQKVISAEVTAGDVIQCGATKIVLSRAAALSDATILLDPSR